jgi:hypothetical protein
MRAPVSRSWPRLFAAVACQSVTIRLVGGLGLLGEFAFGLRSR